ncbi:hypothetical protein ACVI1J_009391 [Bradyrhizobium diazoefficiens]
MSDTDIDPREHAGQELAIRIVENRADLNVAAGLIDLGIERLHHALEAAVRKGVDASGDLLSDFDLVECLLRQREVDKEPVERL